ncbi:acyl-protein thioesterase-1-like protein [Thozetella sp. PMI_491]|nr:acyl-protein thioesterase-1-like protein [Thozetella sp. PMI_491]
MPVYVPPLVIPALSCHTATVVFLHGFGDNGAGWEDAVNGWRRREQLSEIKFILPHATAIPITVNGGRDMPAWFDIKAFGGNTLEFKRRYEDERGILRSTEYIHSIIQTEIDNGVPADRIVVGGFSQGGAMSIFSGLTFTARLAGIFALSSFLLMSLKLATHIPQPELNKQTPVFMAHGDVDEVIATSLAMESYEEIKRQGYNVSLNIYQGLPHATSAKEMADIEAFLIERIPRLKTKELRKLEL